MTPRANSTNDSTDTRSVGAQEAPARAHVERQGHHRGRGDLPTSFAATSRLECTSRSQGSFQGIAMYFLSLSLSLSLLLIERSFSGSNRVLETLGTLALLEHYSRARAHRKYLRFGLGSGVHGTISVHTNKQTNKQ